MRNDGKTERETGRERAKPRGGNAQRCGKYRPVWNMLRAHLGSVNFPDTTNRPVRFQGRLRLEKQSHLMFANTTLARFKGGR